MKTLIYLATPYIHPDLKIVEQRFVEVNKVAAKLMSQGLHIFSPISHTHPIALVGQLPKGWEFWESYDTAMLSVCYKLIVLKQEGWKTSKGVTAEIAIAKKLNLEIEYLEHV